MWVSASTWVILKPIDQQRKPRHPDETQSTWLGSNMKRCGHGICHNISGFKENLKNDQKTHLVSAACHTHTRTLTHTHTCIRFVLRQLTHNWFISWHSTSCTTYDNINHSYYSKHVHNICGCLGATGHLAVHIRGPWHLSPWIGQVLLSPWRSATPKPSPKRMNRGRELPPWTPVVGWWSATEVRCEVGPWHSATPGGLIHMF